MKIAIGVIFVGLIAVLASCGGGVSETEVKDIVNRAIEKSEEDTAQEVKRALAQLAEAEARTDRATKKIVESTADVAGRIVTPICETDYWLLSMFAAIDGLLMHLRDGTFDLEQVRLYLHNGLAITEDHEALGGLCAVDDEWRWRIIEQPHVIAPERRG